VVRTQPANRAQQFACSSATATTRHAECPIVNKDCQVEQLSRHRDILCDLSVSLDCVLSGHVRARRSLAQQDQHWPNSGNARGEVDVRIKVLRHTWAHREVDQRVVQAFQSAPELSAEPIDIQAGSKSTANTHKYAA
jgi:hypothetical protein